MKKFYFTLMAFIVLSAFVKAQEKKYYRQFDFNEQFISERLQEARSNGVDEKEVQHLKEHLQQLRKKQIQDELAGNNARVQVPPPQVLTACVNPGFEDGTTNGWLLEQGQSIGTLPCPTCFTGPGGVYQVLGPGATSNVNTTACACSAIDCSTQPSTGGIDGFGGFSTTAPAPLGGNCLLLNNSDCNYLMERASQTFIVDNTNNAFTFGYAAVLQSGGHATNAQPYFHVDVTDNTTGTVIPCTEYDAVPPTSGSLNGWSTSTVDAAVYTKPWTIVTLDLSTYIGKSVTISFTVSDCNAGGHFGYCYIDAICEPNQITAIKQLCAGGGAAILGGPPGMASYSWTGPVTGSSQNLTTSTPGAYTLTTTNVTGCPAPILTYTLVMNPVPTANFTTNGAACSTNEVFTDASSISSGSIASWNWNFGNGTTAVSNTPGNSQNVGYAPGTYTVTLIDSSTAGCVGTHTSVVTIAPGVSDVFTASTVCIGAATTFNNTSSGGTGYIWDFGDGTPTVSTGTATPNQSHTYATAGTFVTTLSVTTTGTCIATTTVNVTVNSTPTVTAVGNSICNGAGPVNISASGASTYTWDANAGNATTATVSVNPASTTVYSVTATDANGCVSGTTTTVSVIANPTVSVSNTSICPGGTGTLTANSNTTNFSWTGPNIIGSTTNSVVTANPAATSTYSVIATSGTCTVTTTAQIIINPSIVPTFSATTVCEGQPTVFTNTTAGVSTYTWTYGDGNGTTTIPNPSNTYSAAGSYVATFSVVNASGCSGMSTNTIIVNANPTPAFTSSTPCMGTAVTFNNTTSAVPTISTWTWTFGDGNSSSLQAPSNNYAAAGIYSTVLSATTSAGCVGSFTAPVSVYPNPVSTFSNTTVCLNTPPTSFTDQSTLVNPAGMTDNITNWAWSFGDGNTSVTQSPTNAYATCGTFTASLVVTTNHFCVNTSSVVVTVNCVPVLTPPASPTVCPGAMIAPGAFTVSIPGSSVGWNAGTTVTGVSANGVGTVPAYPGTSPNLTGGNISDVITAVPTSTAGCIGLAKTFTVTVRPTPLMNSMPDVTVCDQQQVNVSPFASFPTGSTFGWNNSNTTIGLGASGAGNISPFNGNSSGSPTAVVATVSVTPTLNGCVGPDSVFLITISPQPTVTLTSPPFTCPGSIVPAPTYTLNPNDPAVTFSWTNSNINTGMPANGGPAIQGPFTAAANATMANVVGIVTVTPTLGTCVGQPATYTVTIYPTPVITPAVLNVEYCPNVATNSIAIGMLPASGGVQLYSWIAPTGAAIGLTTTSSTVNIVPSFTTVNTGITAVTSQVIVNGSLDGCLAVPVTFNFTVNPNPIAVFNASSKVCLGAPMSFTDGSALGSGSITQWGWDFNNDGIYTDAVSQNPTFTFASPAGSHTVGLQVTSNKGCKDDTAKTVYVNFIPVPQFAGDVLTGCPVHPVNFVESSSVTGPALINSWAWVFGNGTTFNTQIAGNYPPTVNYDNTSAVSNAYYSVGLTVTTDSGCVASLTNTNYITVYNHPIADFSWGPQDVDVDNPEVYFVDQSQGAAGPSPSYGPNGILWNLGDVFLMNPANNYVNTVKNPVHIYEHYDPYIYSVTQWVENTHGCKDSITKPVEILPTTSFYIPNAFSPNGDGINEGFKGTGVGIDNETYHLWVFDRWGMQIFYTNDMEKTWDGRIQGKGNVVQEDVYVWKVKFSDFRGKHHEYKGTVSVIK